MILKGKLRILTALDILQIVKYEDTENPVEDAIIDTVIETLETLRNDNG